MTESDFAAFEAVGALVVVLDVDGRIVHWNHWCSDLTGYSLEEVRGRKLWDFALLPEEIAPVTAEFTTLQRSDRPSSYANYWVTKTGDRRWIAFSHTLTRHPDGRVQYVIKTGIDRTESKQASDALHASEVKLGARAADAARLYEEARRVTDDLREANQHMVTATIRAQELTERVEEALARSEESERDLRAVAEFRERFIAILGHDLRSPLATIGMLSAGLLRRGHLDEQDRKSVLRTIASSERMSRMIHQLLDFTRARLGGGFPLEPKPTNLRDVFQNVIEELGANVHLEVEGDLTGAWDPDRLAEALSNIAGNAVEHARPGTEVVVRAHAEGEGVIVEILNQGDPIPGDLLPFIFEPFRRGEREPSTAGNLGLGLYIAKQIVLASGGTLDARSLDGTTAFVMRLPRNTLASSASPSQPEAHA
jgi:PAS domain S-box-containing protein